MYDLYHYIGGDTGTSPTGDLRPVSGTERGTQRLLRRLMTNPAMPAKDNEASTSPDYIFHPEYGAGLGKKVGQSINLNEWKSLILGQMLLEDCVATSPEPVVTLTLIDMGVSCNIQYTDAVSGTPATLSFDVTR